MRTFFDVMSLESNKSLSRQGLKHSPLEGVAKVLSLSQRVAVLSIFLHRTSAVCVNLFTASTTHRLCWSESASSGTQKQGPKATSHSCAEHTNLVGVHTSALVRANNTECFSVGL